mgnify:CR=1 FL=1
MKQTKRCPISKEQYKIFSPLFYVMSYEEYLKHDIFHEKEID